MSLNLKAVFTLIFVAGSLASAKAIVCVNKTELVVPIRVTFTSFGANLKANDSTCQMMRVPFAPSQPQFSNWVKLMAIPGACAPVGRVVTNSDLYSITLSREAAMGQNGLAYVDVGPAPTGIPAHTVEAACFATPDPIQ